MVALSPDAANVADWALHALIIALWVVLECNPFFCVAIAAVHYSVSAGWRWQLGGAYSGLALAACGWPASAAILSAAGIAIGLLFPVPVIRGIPGAHDVAFLDYEVHWSLLTAPMRIFGPGYAQSTETKPRVIGRLFYPTARHRTWSRYLFKNDTRLTRRFAAAQRIRAINGTCNCHKILSLHSPQAGCSVASSRSALRIR